MDPPENQRALQVCSICKTRKKRCDKKLPNCGYCAGRGLDCRFDKSFPSQSTDAAVYDPATWRWRLAQIAANRGATSSADASNIASPPRRTSLYDFLQLGKEMALSDVVYIEVSRITEIASLSLYDVSDRFFDGFHRWLPVICQQNFLQATTEIRDRAPKADFSVLLLAMCLIILRPPSNMIQPSDTCLKSLYVTVKSFFAQVQAVMCASTHLIQAGILIAAYEFASRRPETAYISIGICARMSGIVGIDRVEAQRDKGQPEADLTLQVLEKRNVWWGLIVMERLILLEVADRDYQSMTSFPGDDLPLPLDLGCDQLSDSHVSGAPQSSGTLPSTIHHSKIDGFGRQAQAIVMLDQTLRILKLSDTENARLPALMRLDEQLQDFLALIMSEYRTPGRHCGANATIIRTLFLLHQDILGQPTQATSKMTDAQYDTNSLAALDAAARMMAAVAGHHVEHLSNIDIVPVCAAYNAQIATEHIKARRDHVGGDSLAALKSLDILVKAFRQRWPTHEGLW